MQNEIIKPLVSVIMPNYRTPIRYLSAAIDSILSQTYSDFELIIIDDASGDESVAYLERLTDYRIVLLKNSENHGPAYSRNCGLNIAQGGNIS